MNSFHRQRVITERAEIGGFWSRAERELRATSDELKEAATEDEAAAAEDDVAAISKRVAALLAALDGVEKKLGEKSDAAEAVKGRVDGVNGEVAKLCEVRATEKRFRKTQKNHSFNVLQEIADSADTIGRSAEELAKNAQACADDEEAIAMLENEIDNVLDELAVAVDAGVISPVELERAKVRKHRTARKK